MFLWIVIVELVTVLISILLKFYGVINSVLNIYDKGYKLSSDIDRILDECDAKNVRGLIEDVLLFVPGVNLVSACVANLIYKNNVFDNAKKENILIEMNDLEKRQYENLNNKFQKFVFVTLMSNSNGNTIIQIINNIPTVVELGLLSLDYDRLLPLSYTLEEVKKLNSITKLNYKLGIVDGINIAIIGLPNLDMVINRVQFKSEDYDNKYVFKEMTDDENKRFVIYPYCDDFDVDLEKGIEEIRNMRKNKNIDISKTTISKRMETYNLVDEKRGVLKKVLKRKK